MAYLGKGLGSLTTANITVDKMTGNGSTATLTITLAQGVNSVNDISVFVSGVMQRPGTDYTLSGSTLTFTTAPANGLQVVAVSHGDSVLDCVADATAITASFDNNSVPDSAIGSLAASKLTGALAGAATNLTGLNAAQLTGALPAVAATNLTNLTSANLTGALPALSAANLTGITSYTKSASDPAADTNPSGGTGSVWVNYTSGETYVCTDATTDANVWTNVGSGDGDIQPWLFTDGGAYAGYVMGGYPYTTRVERYEFTSTGSATTIGNLGSARAACGGASSETHGFAMGGGPGNISQIVRFQFQAGAGVSMVDVGTMNQAGVTAYSGAGGTAPGYGYQSYTTSGGDTGMQKFAFASSGIQSTHVGINTTANYAAGSPTLVSSDTHIYIAGGEGAIGAGAPYEQAGMRKAIQKYSIASDGNCVFVANLTQYSYGRNCGAQTSTHGYMGGMYLNGTGNLSNIDKWSYATEADATNVGTLATARGWTSNTASASGYMFMAGGGYPSQTTEIDKFSFASEGASTNQGNLIAAHRSSGHAQH